MTSANSVMTPQRARALLGVGPNVDARTLRRAFGAAAKKLHPDRPGGDARRFREAVGAYHLLQAMYAPSLTFLPAVAEATSVETLGISPVIAMRGGELVSRVPDGRTLRLTLPAGLRQGDRIRAGDVVLPVEIRNDEQAAVRGDDFWLTLRVPTRVLEEGGRVLAKTSLGQRPLQIDPKEAGRRLVRRPGEGLPARGPHKAGDLFLRLEQEEGQPVREGSARALLRRFAATWAA